MKKLQARASSIDSDPEVLFHRYFGTLSDNNRRHYWGKYDLAKASLTDFERLLLALQYALNDSLNDADQNLENRVEHSPFHVDYVDSSVENAIAFRYEGCSFIGVTIPLMSRLWNLCVSVDPIAAEYLRPALRSPIDPGGLGTVLFRTLLSFIVAHEYTHHVHGHVSRADLQQTVFDEISSLRGCGGLEC